MQFHSSFDFHSRCEDVSQNKESCPLMVSGSSPTSAKLSFSVKREASSPVMELS